MLEHAPHSILRLGSDNASIDDYDERMQVIKSAALLTRGLRSVFYDSNSSSSQDQSSAGNQDVAFLIFATAVVGLIVLCYVVCMYHYVRWCLCSKPRPGFSGDDPDGEANSAVPARADMIFHLTTRQRRAVLETFFLDTSKAVTTNESPSKKSKLTSLDIGVGESHDKELDKPAPILPTSEGTAFSLQEIKSVPTLSESHHSADADDDNNQDELLADDAEANLGDVGAEAAAPNTSPIFLSIDSCCDQISQSSPDTTRKAKTSAKPSILPKWRLFQRRKSLSMTSAFDLGNEEKLEEIGDVVLEDDRKHYFDNENEKEDSVCAICICEYEEGETIIQAKHCSHFFHKECILEWLEKHDMCPICREHMITKDEVDAAANIVVGKERMIRAIASYSAVSPTASPAPRLRLQMSRNEGRVRSRNGGRTRSRRYSTSVRGSNRG